MNQKRLSVPLLPEVERVIDNLTKITGSSKSQILLRLQTESIDHLKLKYIMAKYLKDNRFNLSLELETGQGRPDLVAKQKNKIIGVECLTVPFDALCIQKVVKYSKLVDEIIFAIPKDEFNESIFRGLGVNVFLCNLSNNKIEYKKKFKFDPEIFNEKKIQDSIIVPIKLGDTLNDIVNDLVKSGLYSSKAEVVRAGIRTIGEKHGLKLVKKK